MPLLKLKQISSIDNYYKFTFEPISVHFGTCSLINMTRYIYRFLSDMGTRNCISEVKNFIPFRLDGIQIIINLSFINCDKAISQNNIKNCEIVMRKMYYTFKTNHYITFNYLILMAIKKQAKIEMDGSELIYPEELTILIPKGDANKRFDPNLEKLVWIVDNWPFNKKGVGYILNRFARRLEPDFLLPDDEKYVLRKLYPTGKVFHNLII